MKIALISSPTNIYRFTPGLTPFVQEECDFWQIDIYRPVDEIHKLIKKWKPDGIITEFLPEITKQILEPTHIPTVICPNDEKDFPHPHCSYVDVDDIDVGIQAARYFCNQGYENLAFYGNNTPYSRQRLKGYKEYLSQQEMNLHLFQENIRVFRRYTEYWQDFTSTAQDWLLQLPKPCAIFVAHDPLARSLIERCRHAKIRVPEDVSIVSANNDPLICNLVNPPLSSISIPWNRIGFEAARILIEKIHNRYQGPVTTKIQPIGVEQRQSSDILQVKDPVLGKALHFIRNHIGEKLQVTDVVDHCRTSRRTLEKLFKTYLKKSPREEILRLRIERAQKYLTDTDIQMPEIAERCGFGHQERFTVSFRQYTNMTPSAYRKKFRWNIN